MLAQSMNFPLLRDAFDNDADELRAFVDILERELAKAADQLEPAIAGGHADEVADIRHKLRTSLSMTGATDIYDRLGEVRQSLTAGHSVPDDRRHSVTAGLHDLVRRLRAERW